MAKSKLFTIGFAGKSAEQFFLLLNGSGAKELVDIRISRSSQLSGFAKERDIAYFLKQISGMRYTIMEELAPEKPLLADYRKRLIDWDEFSIRYIELLNQRRVFENKKVSFFEDKVLLCSEPSPEKCHRRLLAEQIAKLHSNLEIVHLS